MKKLDDDNYKTTTSTEEVAKRIAKVNQLKSFLLDDVPGEKHTLSIPMSKDMMYKLLSQMKDGSSFTVNNRFSCQLNNGKDGTGEVFSSAKQDANCPRTSQEASVLVYDKKTGEDLDGLLVLNYDKDLASSYSVMLYVKHHGQSQWEFGTEAVIMSDIKAQMS